VRVESALLDAAAASPFAGQRVLLTGASGFLGWHVARQGLAAGVEVHCLGRSPGPAGAHFHKADLRERDKVCHAVARIAPSAVLNVASPGVAFGTAKFAEILETVTLGAEALLTACVELPEHPHFVHVGTGFEYVPQNRPIREDDPLVPSATSYGAAKAAASAAVGAFARQLPINIVRPFNIYGAGDTAPRLGRLIMDHALAGKLLETSAGEQVRDFIHVDDCARSLWEVAAAPGRDNEFRIFNVGSNEPRRLRDYVEAIAAALAAHDIDLNVEFGAVAYRPGEPMRAVPDLTRIMQTLSWRPNVSFETGIADFVNWSIARCG
jgi:UDP-glucose 4-epimerase